VRLRTSAEVESTEVRLRLHDCGVSTSGDLHQFVEIAGKRYAHIIDPKTGLGLTSGVACSVVAPDATTSDAWATTLCILGAERGLADCSKTIRAFTHGSSSPGTARKTVEASPGISRFNKPPRRPSIG
jgi:thiamine biosynthesis lipoprotein ApbE